MFLSFKITNYRSIGKEITIDFGIRDSQRLGAYTEINEQAINKIGCLVGPNAGGKSNVLKGIVQFLRYMHKSYSTPSFRDLSGFTTHFCCKDTPIGFSTEFLDKETQYKYELTILNGIVQNEILEKRNETTKRYSYIFKRSMQSVSFCTAIKMNQRDINRLGNDMSIMSLLFELNYFEKSEFHIFKTFFTNVQPGIIFSSINPLLKWKSISQELMENNLLLDELIDELKTIDTGISSLMLQKVKFEAMVAGSNEISSNSDFLTILTNHKIANTDYILPVVEESSGTLHYIETFIHLSKVLQSGGLFIADELEQSLHPDLTARIINRFTDKDKNPNNAQLLFTTHNPWFLQDLTKTQIFITEKNEEAQTEITRLDEIAGVRNDENYFTKYIAGEYDGRPKIKEI